MSKFLLLLLLLFSFDIQPKLNENQAGRRVNYHHKALKSATTFMPNVFCSYRSHKNVLATYLGSVAEQEKLQKLAADVVV